jgi:LPS sulfotransferase NodH
MKKFLLATPRSGSTMVMDILEQMGCEITPSYDHFYCNSPQVPFLKEDGTLDGFHRQKRTSYINRWGDLVLLNSLEEITHLVEILRRSKPDYIFKIFPNHFNYGTITKNTIIKPPKINCDFSYIRDCMNPDFSHKIKHHPISSFLKECEGVRLIRRDKMAQLLSEVKAKKTDIFLLRDVCLAPTEPSQQIISRKVFDDFVQQQIAFEKSSIYLNVVDIFYEDIMDDPSILNQAFGLSGQPPKSRLSVQRTDYRWVANLREVETWFRDLSFDIR